MRGAHRVLVFALAVGGVGCTCDSEEGVDAGGVDGGGVDTGVATGMDAGMDGGGVVTLPDGAILLPDGAVIRGAIPCQGHVYQCGDTLDNDSDGLTDDKDPDCLGPCDNNEGGFYLNIPGGDANPCQLDCYFDQDEGPGNDQCNWDHRCDPLEPSLDAPPTGCGCDPEPCRGGSTLINTCCAPPSASCPDTQVNACAEICGPLVPNGCDCFGCCNLPAGGDRWVFIGSVDTSGQPTCTLDDMESDEACHPCTPVPNCLNDCGACELCLGRTELPEECRPSVDAGPQPDGAVPVDAGTPTPVCDDGRQPCGVEGLAECPESYFCVTGCCTYFG